MSGHVYGYVVMGNEVDRYLQSFMKNLMLTVDATFVFDDQSSDGSADLVRSFANVIYCRRDDSTPTFLEHEGRFRHASWVQFQRYVGPRTDDWVLAIDADEVLVGPDVCRPCELGDVIRRADQTGVVLLDRPEVWDLDPIGWPLVRKDGAWGNIRCTRLFRYRPGGQIKDVPFACGSEPDYVAKQRPIDGAPLQLLHYGYCDSPEDRQAHYANYSVRSGHNPMHIRSMIDPNPRLERWSGLLAPTMKRGRDRG